MANDVRDNTRDDSTPMENIELRDLEEERRLLGPRDRYRRRIGERYGVEIVTRGGVVKLIGAGAAVAAARRVIDQALVAIRGGEDDEALERIFTDRSAGPGRARDGESHALAPGIHPRTEGQERYVRSLEADVISIVIGPAGSGKTFLGVACAVAALRRGQFKKLVLARPAVEAGERLGFLPGDLQAKVNPYLRPLYDALHALLEGAQVRRYLENDVIEIVPLAYMRGRTLDHAYIILDEAQNTTPKQMKMFLTRMGEGSKVVVTGDVTQTDLPQGEPSGLVHCIKVLEGVSGIGVVKLRSSDIVRHPVVQEIVDAYERAGDDAGAPAPAARDSAPPRGRGRRAR